MEIEPKNFSSLNIAPKWILKSGNFRKLTFLDIFSPLCDVKFDIFLVICHKIQNDHGIEKIIYAQVKVCNAYVCMYKFFHEHNFVIDGILN